MTFPSCCTLGPKPNVLIGRVFRGGDATLTILSECPFAVNEPAPLIYMSNKVYNIVYLPEPKIEIDGRLDESAWKKATLAVGGLSPSKETS